MRLSGKSAASTRRTAVLALAVCLLAAACGGSEKPEPERVTAAQQCDDTLSPEAARALETVLGTQSFGDVPAGGLERVARQLVADFPVSEGRTPRRSLCTVSPSTGGLDRVTVEYRFWRDINLHGDEHSTGLHPYDMGVEALSGSEGAHLYVRCVSPRFPGSEKRPARIWGVLRVGWNMIPDTVPVREATLTILHSTTLAVVRKLGCVNDAGLDAKPAFKPLPE
ncbi:MULTISPECIES: hypothetical protein [unclassified Streptomyces]|uniref:hypothetical protein n=1 Tax=unclassified Streptomyces TaxID=2593676 RepID=UPI00068FD0C8